MERVKRRLVFNFYASNEWSSSYCNNIHFNCLKHYDNIFDECIFFIVVDDIDNRALINAVESKILSLSLSSDIQFKVKENHYLREAINFYNEISLNLQRYDGITFFAHNKGTTNFIQGTYSKENIERWITIMYYNSLNFIDEVDKALTDERYLAYGPLLDKINYEEFGDNDKWIVDRSKLHLGERAYFYMGTFFWMNCNAIDGYIKKQGREIPKIYDRWYAENFLSNLVEFEYCTSHLRLYVTNYVNGGVYINDIINGTLYMGDAEDYNNFNNMIINQSAI